MTGDGSIYDQGLDSCELAACARLIPVLGPLRRLNGQGVRPDFAADLADGSVAAIEVTGEVDPAAA